ncbi:MAG: sporulation protein YqfD [Clostridia bacterium]|nr:sporulation protein YqfD [Clostridia bacterium]
MVLLTQKFLVIGKNRQMLLNRLKKRGVGIIKLKILSENRMEITIDKKQSTIFFAICKNMWYNIPLRVGGLLSPFYLLVKKPLIALCVALYFLIAIYGGNLYFGAHYLGDSVYFKPQIEQALKSVGISELSYFTQDKLVKAQLILSKTDGIAFVSLQKWGNKAIIDIKGEVVSPNYVKTYSSDIVANEHMKIIYVAVYSGTQLVNVGDVIDKGDAVVGAYHLINEEKIPCEIIAEVIAECVFEYEYQSRFDISDGTLSHAIAAARLALGDYLVTSYKTEKINENTVKVFLTYNKQICGG